MSVVALPRSTPVPNWETAGFYPYASTTQATVPEFERGAVGLIELDIVSPNPRPGFGTYRVAGGAGFLEDVRLDVGVECISCGSNSIGDFQTTLGAIRAMPVTDITGLAAGYRNPSWQRVFRFGFRMLGYHVFTGEPRLSRNTGFMMIPFAAPQTVDTWNSWEFAIANNGGFGIVGSSDITNGWSWGVYTTGASPGNIVEEVLLGVDATIWNEFEIQITSGAPGRQALLELFVNGVAFLNRGWVGPAPLIPSLLAGELGWNPSFRYGDGGANPDIRFSRTDWTFSAGRFLRDGTEILT